LRPPVRTLLFFLSLFSIAWLANAQARPTATQPLRLSVFGGATGADVGLAATRNLGATAGIDAGFGSFFGLQPAIELRGTDAADGHVVSSEKNALIGIRIAHSFGRIQPYVDVLYGRGILYYGNGYLTPTSIYTYTSGNILSPGAGIDLALTEHFSVKIDEQYQRVATPVTASHVIYITPLTFGVVYHFNFNRRPHIDKRMP
jgi:hypothetical protein